jgi:hypothetical protein
MKAKQHTGQVCPSCYHPMKQGAIICVHCGFSLQLGRKMETQVHGKGDGGHGESAALALQRAANMLEEDKREEKKKTSEGVPWWAYLIMFCAAVGLLTMMMLLPPATATGVAMMFLAGGVFLMALYAHIMVIIIAFKDNVAQGLCVLFIPCYWWIYSIMHWDQCGMLFLMKLGAVIVNSCLGAGIQYYESTKDPGYPAVGAAATPKIVAAREADKDLLGIPPSRESKFAPSQNYADTLQ